MKAAGAPNVLLVNAAGRAGEKLLWLDRSCNGLLSWARARGLFRDGLETKELVLLVPERGGVDRAYVWFGEGAFPWDEVPDEAARWSLSRVGDFAKAELARAEARLGKIPEWEAPEPPRCAIEGEA